MPQYLSPGVYVEEVEAGSRPIEGVGTAVAAFVGFSAKGPLHEPTLVTNWAQFVSTYGDFVEGAYLASAVYGFFANGGGICYVVRVGDPLTAGNGKPAEGVAGPPAELGGYRVRALPGVTGKITVEETYPMVTTKRGRDNVVNQVRERSKLINLEEGTGAAKPEAQVVAVPAAP